MHHAADFPHNLFDYTKKIIIYTITTVIIIDYYFIFRVWHSPWNSSGHWRNGLAVSYKLIIFSLECVLWSHWIAYTRLLSKCSEHSTHCLKNRTVWPITNSHINVLWEPKIKILAVNDEHGTDRNPSGLCWSQF